MLIVLHGDDVTASRNKLHELLEGKHTARHNARHENISLLLTSLESQELFAAKRFIVIENVFDNATLTNKITPGFVRLQKNKEVTVILWQDKIIDKRMLSKLPSAVVHVFLLPKYFYSFLDNFVPQNAIMLHKNLFSLYPQFSEEQVFYALVKRLRVLIMLKSSTSSAFKDSNSLTPWQLSKLTKQASLWNSGGLISFFTQLFDLEVRMKTSALPMPLINHLDILIMKELN